VLRDLRIDRVLVRQDDRGRWWYRLEGNLDKILGIAGRDFAVPDEPFAAWTDEPDDTVKPADPSYQEGSCPRGDSTDVDPLLLPFRGTVRAA
jgi:hypothetical protein